jgi:hypothetical protein
MSDLRNPDATGKAKSVPLGTFHTQHDEREIVAPILPVSQQTIVMQEPTEIPYPQHSMHVTSPIAYQIIFIYIDLTSLL